MFTKLIVMGFPGGPSGKEAAFQCRRHKRLKFDLWVRKIPWRRAWQPTLVFLPGESHGQRNPVRHGPWGHRELDTTEATQHAHTQTYCDKYFMMYVGQIIMLYMLNLYSVVWQLYLNKTGR